MQAARAQYSLYLLLCCLAVPVVIFAMGFHGCEVRHGAEKDACDQGSLNKCLEVAKAYDPDDPNGLIPFLFDYAVVAKREYGKACELGSAQACWRFSEITRQGGGAFVSTSSAEDELHGLIKACEGKVAEACAKLGVKYASGDGVPRDEVKAAALLKPACEISTDGDACYWYGTFLWQGRGGIPADPAAGKSWIDIACHLRVHEACIAQLDPGLRLALDDQACDGGDDAACRQAKRRRSESR